MQDAPVLTEMAFTRALAEQKVRGREETINEHLVKLMAFEAPAALRESWKRELVRKHFRLLASIRVKPDRPRIAARDFLAWLYEDPFVGNEAGYVAAMVSLNSDQYRRNDRPDTDIADRLLAFHRAMSGRLGSGEDGADLLDAL